MTTTGGNTTLDTARAYAEHATAVAAKLKPGTYEAVQALALTSIAHSLTVIAASVRQD
jgi:hypothetical protein